MTTIGVYRRTERIDGAFTLENALKRARSVAGGRRSRKVRRGDRLGYDGPGGFVYVNETEAREIDAENRSNHADRL